MKIRHVFFIAIILSLVCMFTGDCKKAKAASFSEDAKQGYEFADDETVIVNSDYFGSAKEEMLPKFAKVKHIIIKQEDGMLLTWKLSCFTNATSITIPENIDYIDNQIVVNLPKLEKFEVDKDNKVYTSIDGILYSKSEEELLLYPHGAKAEVNVKKGTKSIGEQAFYKAPIQSVTIPDGLVIIGSKSFADTNIKTISLPASFRILERDSFKGSKLESVTIDSSNTSLCSIDGVVYNKKQTFLYYYPEGKKVEKLTFPETLTFLDCARIPCFSYASAIAIPKGLTAITNTENNQLKSIEIAPNQPYLKLEDGVLYTSNYKRIRLYPNQNTDTEITLHNNLEVFPMELFYKENTTKVLVLPKNLKKLKGQIRMDQILLSGFRNLQELRIDSVNKEFKVVDGVLYNADQTSLLWYPSDLNKSTFAIPDSVTLVENEQFTIQNNLTELTIPKDCNPYHEVLTSDYDFSCVIPIGKECPKLKRFIVDKDNPYYCSVDGVLFSKDMKVLRMYPSQKEDKTYSIPEGVSKATFTNSNPYLTKLTIPASCYSFGVEKYYDGPGPVYGNSLLEYSALSEIVVSEGNENLTIMDGALVTIYGDVLIAYPMARKATEFSLPKQTYLISNVAFFTEHPYLKTVYVDPTSREYSIEQGILTAINYESVDLDFGEIELKYKEN